MLFFSLSQIVAQHVNSLEVPEVVGTAIILIGSITCGALLLRTKSVNKLWSPLKAANAFAVSVTDPPPTATIWSICFTTVEKSLSKETISK